MLNRETKREEDLNDKRRAWLNEHGYDIGRQLELEKWCRDNIEVAIEELYGYPYRSLQWEKVYKEFMTGNAAIQTELYKRACSHDGFMFFNFNFPPKGYQNISLKG